MSSHYIGFWELTWSIGHTWLDGTHRGGPWLEMATVPQGQYNHLCQIFLNWEQVYILGKCFET